MIIRKVRLSPFGGAANREYAIEPGLNVLLGPNEAGKSTLVTAIFAALFVPPDVKKNTEDWKNFLAKCLPHPDGDTARVAIEFAVAGKGSLSYRCAWGAGREERLVLADGSEINDPAAVRERLQEALRFGRGTYQGVLFARQEEMVQTLARLKSNPEASRTISDLLRSALFEAGGVSLEELAAAIAAEEKRLLQNWDCERDEPRGGRGIDNPHKMGRGAVLTAYYRVEELRRKLRQARAAEEQAADLARRLAESAAEQEQLLGRLKSMESLEDDARHRSALEPRLETIGLKETELKKVVSEWPRVEERVQGIEKQAADERKRLAALEQEFREAGAVLNARQQRELLARARPLQTEVAEKEAALADLPPLSQADLKYLEQQLQELTNLKAVAEAMKLKASFSTQKPLELVVTAGLEEPRRLAVEAEASLEGAGRLLIESPEWTLEVQSGEGDVARLLEQSRACRSAFADRLSELSVQDIGEARAIRARRDDLERSLESARIRLAGLRGDLSFSELETAVAELGPDRPVRDPELIKTAVGELNVSLGTLTVKLEQEQEKLNGWAAEFDCLDRVMDAMAELRRQARESEAELARLAPLPEEFASGDQFINALKEKRAQRDALKDRIAGLKEKLIEARNRLPEESTEDLEAALLLAGEELARLKGQGKAVRLVEDEFNTLKAELDSDTLLPLADSFARNLALATGNRYTAASLDGAVPGEISSAEGKALPVELLSTGTAGSVALALRLAMSGYLLQGADGFLIMDDPMVNLDPERKKAAAELIREFAREKQIIVTTCDPGTAELLGGNVVTV